MALTIKPFKEAELLDINDIVRNFSANRAGTYVRHSASGSVIGAIGNAVNSLVYFNPMTFFTRSTDYTASGYRNASPTYSDGYPLYIPNFDPVTMQRGLSISTEPVLSNDYIDGFKPSVRYYYNTTYEVSVTLSLTDNVLNELQRYVRHNYPSVKTLSTYLSMTPTDTYVSESIWVGAQGVISDEDFGFMNGICEHLILKEVPYFYTMTFSSLAGDICPSNLTRPFNPILADSLENIRQLFHKVRTNRTPILLSWGEPSGTASPYLGSESASFENVLIASYSSWLTYSPGFSNVTYMSGIGPEDEAAGQTVDVECYCYACAYNSGSPGGAATVRFEGPTNITYNYADIPIGDSWAWHSAATRVKLNTGVDYDNTTTSRSKIDVLSKIGDGSDEVRIRGLFARVTTTPLPT